MLQIQPYPSPYLSDWEANPNIATLTLVNPTTSSQDVVLRYDIHNQQGALLASGRSDPQTIPAGSPTIYTSFVDIEGSSQHDPTLESEMTTTGRIPEGVYTVCVLAADAQNLVLARTCEQFTIVYPDPPMLISPADGAIVTTTSPVFQWTPLQVPPDYQIRYIFQIAEEHPGQMPAAALAANIPLYENRDVGSTVLEYPLDAQPFEQGKTYVWRVMALDQNGYPPSTNGGMSEIQTFQYDDGSTPLPPPASSLATLQLLNANARSGATADPPSDTLGFAQICLNWKTGSDVPANYVLAVNTPWGFHPMSQSAALVYRDTADTKERLWWIYASRGHREVLIHGKCRQPYGGLQWIATRRSDHQTLNRWLTDSAAFSGTPLLDDSLQFATWVFALRPDSVWVPDSAFRNQESFFEGHSFEAKPGVNAYAILSFGDRGLWSFFHDVLGYQEKAVTIKGFVGLGISRTLGLGAGGGEGPSANLSSDATLLSLAAELPERKPKGFFGNFFESSHVSVELEVGLETGVTAQPGDSNTATTTSSASVKVTPKIAIAMKLRDDKFKDVVGSRELVGAISFEGEHELGADTVKTRLASLQAKLGTQGQRALHPGMSDSCAAQQEAELAKGTPILSLELDGKVGVGPFYIEKPALEFHLPGLALKRSAETKKTTTEWDKELELDMAATLAIKKLDFGAAPILGLSIKPPSKEKKPTTCGGTASDTTKGVEGSDTTSQLATRPRSNTISEGSDTTVTSRPRSNAFSEGSDTTSTGSGKSKTAWYTGKLKDALRYVHFVIKFPADIRFANAVNAFLAFVTGGGP